MRSLETIANNSYIEKTFTAEYDNPTLDGVGNLGSTVIITPATGKSIKVVGFYLSTAAVGLVKLEFNTSANSAGVIEGVANGNTASGYIPVNITGAINESLSLISNVAAASRVFVLVNYQVV